MENCIKNRRSIRRFKDVDVSKEDIMTILDAGRLSPSSKNRQPWYFVVCKNDMKNKIVDIMESNEELNALNKDYVSSVKHTAKIIKQAPVLILVYKVIDQDWLMPDILSLGACIENICLQATSLHLGSLWIRDTYFVQNQIEALFNLDGYELNSCIAIGYPDENPNQRPRKQLDMMVSWFE